MRQTLPLPGRASLAPLLALIAAACSGASTTQPVGDPAPPAPPTELVAAAGAQQQAPAGGAVPVRPAVQVRNGAGGGVPGIVITFRVVSGGGSLTGATATTDAQGIATVGSWTLGATPGPNVLAARADGLPEASFTATGTAPTGSGTMTAQAGTDAQTARAGAAVAVAPAVLVRNAQGAPVAGVAVTFRVASGGGTATGTTATSNAQGIANVGSWTLGAAAGTNTLVASAAGYPDVTFTAQAVTGGAPTLTREVVLGALSAPWDLAFTPDGAMFVSERGGRLQVRLADGTLRTLPAIPDLVVSGQSGLLGLAIDPQFASNRHLYAFIASNLGGTTANRVVRWRVDAGYTTLSDRRDIVTGIAWGNGGAHSGGRIRFGPDGYLWIGTGDTRTGSVPQDLASLGSKVLRVDREGNAAPGNGTFPRAADPRILAYGFRNVQGLAFRGSAAYACEHGPGYDDEVTRLAPGGNGGWDPVRPPSTEYLGYNGTMPMSDQRFADLLRPTWVLRQSSGMSGCTTLTGPQWGSWDGALIVALLSGRRAEVVELDAAGTAVTRTTPVLNHGERLRTVVQGPDGNLYVLTDGRAGGDQVWRVRPGP